MVTWQPTTMQQDVAQLDERIANFLRASCLQKRPKRLSLRQARNEAQHAVKRSLQLGFFQRVRVISARNDERAENYRLTRAMALVT